MPEAGLWPPARADILGITPPPKSLVWAPLMSFKQLQIFLRDGPWPCWNSKASVSLYFASPISLWQEIWGFYFTTLMKFLKEDNRRVGI